jgi:hypothetical protein
MFLRLAITYSPSSVRSWTGRSAMTSATQTPRPHLATAGTRQTRVSAMRAAAPRTAAPTGRAIAGISSAQHRWPRVTSHTSD